MRISRQEMDFENDKPHDGNMTLELSFRWELTLKMRISRIVLDLKMRIAKKELEFENDKLPDRNKTLELTVRRELT